MYKYIFILLLFFSFSPFVYGANDLIELGDVVIDNKNVTLNIKTYDVPTTVGATQTPYKIYLGAVLNDESTNGAICTTDQSLSKPFPLTEGTNVTPISFTNLSEGTYCVTINASAVALIPADYPRTISCEADEEKFSSFCSPFSIGNGSTTITNLSKSSIARTDKYGCESTGTEIYCPLQPLPGTVDPDTKGIDVREGFGNFLNRMIILFMGIISILSVLMVAISGIEYMSAEVISSKKNALDRLKHALLGLFIALSSYALLNTINPNLVDLKITVPGAEVSYVPAERRIGTADGSIPNNLPPVDNINIPTGAAKVLATQILSKGNKITLLGDTADPTSSAKQNIIDTSEGKSAWTSTRSDVKRQPVAIDSRLLGTILAISELYSIQVNHIAGGDHSSTSKHYQGKAFDIQHRPFEPTKARAIMDVCRAGGAYLIIGPCSTYSDKVCKDTGYKTRDDHSGHIHCAWK